ncbi:MAG TPA: nucleoside hydrolase [Elainellaceae cyanobacterium]|jgi:purine nucleosidase
MTSRPIIIDCDPGVDDAIALLLAFASPELELLGITTVAGNVPLSLTQTNARKICELAMRPNIPVYAGCPRPIVRSLITAENIHGNTGLDGTDLPDPQISLQPQHAVQFLIETLLSADSPITLVALGPLTNLAIALIQEPRIIPNIQEIVLMGGAIAQGNITSSAEFNMYVDPHAAHVVFTSGIDITLIGLDITHQVLTTRDRLDAIRAISTPVSTVAADLLAHYGAHDIKQYGFAGGPLHDPNVIAYLIQPDLYTSRKQAMTIETTSDLTMGRTVVDTRHLDGRSPHVNVVKTVDAEGFYHLLIERLAQV